MRAGQWRCELISTAENVASLNRTETQDMKGTSMDVDLVEPRSFLVAPNRAGYAEEQVGVADGLHTITFAVDDWTSYDNSGGESILANGRHALFRGIVDRRPGD